MRICLVYIRYYISILGVYELNYECVVVFAVCKYVFRCVFVPERIDVLDYSCVYICVDVCVDAQVCVCKHMYCSMERY